MFAQLAASPEGVSAETLAKLPAHLRKTSCAAWRERELVAPVPAPVSAAAVVALNADQRLAAETILASSGRFSPFVLFGVTGSGKTDVYLDVAARTIAAGGQVLLLVPEINLTPQLEQRVRAALPGASVVLLHSGLADGARREHWREAATGKASLVLGTRLGVFAPMPALALVIVDEEHDASYKQQDNVRYHARDVAVWRAHRRRVPVVLGSATPSLESWLHAQEGRYVRLDLPRRADPRARMPQVRFAGSRPARAQEGIGEPLRAALAARLARGEQSLVFVNRRGFSPSLLCSACGWEADCPRCSARLTVHRTPAMLRCHHCGHDERLPQACPDCGNVDLLPLGFGTQRLERVLAEAYPSARIARIDRDSTRARGSFALMRDQMTANELDILVGTQMLAKGHDFPRLTLVGVLGADNALYSADFRATERLAALLMQVAGRAGRAGLARRSHRPDRLSRSPGLRGASRARLRAAGGKPAGRAENGAIAAIHARGGAGRGGPSSRRRRRLPARCARGGARAGGHARGAGRDLLRRCRRCWRAGPASNGGRSSCKAHAGRRCSSSFRRGETRSLNCPAARSAGFSTSIRPALRERGVRIDRKRHARTVIICGFAAKQRHADDAL